MKRTWTPDQVAELRHLYLVQRMMVKDIAVYLGRTYLAVDGKLDTEGIREELWLIQVKQADEAYRLLKDNTITEVAAITGHTYGQIKHWVRQFPGGLQAIRNTNKRSIKNGFPKGYKNAHC